MTYQVKRSDLNQDKYKYKWSVDSGDNPNYTGKLDRAKVDKDEGYEVLSLIQSVFNEKGYVSEAFVSFLEDKLHSPALKSVQSREELKKELLKSV